MFLGLEAVLGRPAVVRYGRVETGPHEFTADPALLPGCEFELADPFHPAPGAR